MNTNALGIDIGGTKIAAAIVGADGRVTAPELTPTPVTGGAPAIIKAIVALCRRLLDTSREQGLTVAALGVGTAGHVDHRRGVVSYASNLLPGWSGVALADALQALLPLPVSVENDVNAMAIGEGRFGAGQEFQEMLYVAIGTGVGGALVHRGQLWRGATWTAGELGHMVVDWDGQRRCGCGQTGHLEAYTAGPALAERYRQLAGLETPCDLQVVAERAYDGDSIAQQAIAEGASILGIALSGLLNVFDPQALIIGGGVGEVGEIWWRPFEAALRANPMPGPAQVALRRAQLGGNAVLIGAAWLALCEYAPEFAGQGEGKRALI